MTCSRRGKPRVAEIWPKLEEPKRVPGALNCALLKRLMISARTIRVLLPLPRGSTFWSATSVCVLNGVRMRVSVRGALPKVKAGACDHAAGLNQLLMQEQAGS